jgi:hypothetical protein
MKCEGVHMMNKEVKENGVIIGSMAVAGACTLMGSCQIGAIAMVPAVLYQGTSVIKDVVKKQSKIVITHKNRY